MSQSIKLKKGFDIKVAGSADLKILDTDQPETFALKPTDFHSICLNQKPSWFQVITLNIAR